MTGCAILDRCRYLIRDRDTKFTSAFDTLFKSVGIGAIKLPAWSPNLNAFAERFIRSIKSEYLERMIFYGKASLRHAISEYIAHYHEQRFHQGIGNVIPFPADRATNAARDGTVVCQKKLGGWLRSYHRKKAA